VVGNNLAAPVRAIASSADGGGYWITATDGTTAAFGDAPSLGPSSPLVLNAPVVGPAVSPGGQGLWLVTSDGGSYALGNAPFDGSMGGTPLDAPIVGMIGAA